MIWFDSLYPNAEAVCLQTESANLEIQNLAPAKTIEWQDQYNTGQV